MNKLQPIIFIIALSLLLSACNNRPNDAETPNDFNFILEYGILNSGSSNNTINTYDNIFEFDTEEGIARIDLRLTSKDIEKIYQKIDELQLINYSTNVDRSSKYPSMDIGHGHNGYWKLKVNYDGVEKTFYWTTKTFPLVTTKEINKAIEKGQTIRDFMLEESEYDEQLIKLYNLSDIANYIIDIIEGYEEMKELPPKKLYL